MSEPESAEVSRGIAEAMEPMERGTNDHDGHGSAVPVIPKVVPEAVPEAALEAAVDPDRSILYKSKQSVKVGEVLRYTIEYTPSQDSFRDVNDPPYLWLKIKNIEALPLRAAYLAGPYILYVDITSDDYDQNKPVFSTAEYPIYEPQLKAGQSLYAKLYLNKVRRTYRWTVNVVSQVVFSTSTDVQFSLLIGRVKHSLESSSNHPKSCNPLSGLSVNYRDTLDIWNSPIPRKDSPLHLVIVTHGLHSNVSADMLYLKDKIDEMARKTGENIIVRGYFGNVCKTEKGVKYLGSRVGDYIMNDLCNPNKKGALPAKISFIAHSLGGLIQTYAVAHIQSKDPQFFQRIKPIHFICLATPFLGVSNENPAYVKLALDFGFVGKTGRDLGLSWKLSTNKRNKKPLLRVLPTGPTHEILLNFSSRTLYANMINDGIVPLRTSAILYLDWRALSRAQKARDNQDEINSLEDANPERNADITNEAPEPDTDSNMVGGSAVSEVPDDSSVSAGSSSTKGKKSGGMFNFNAFFSFMAPQGGAKKPGKIYRRSQALFDDDGDDDGDNGSHTKENETTVLPKSTSMLESGVSVLLPPLPSMSFITNPKARPQTIVHDKIYSEANLPPQRYQKRHSFGSHLTQRSSRSPGSVGSGTSETGSLTSNNEKVEKLKVEEKIARDWHRELQWRKVLVVLEPDAHNNIIVRRRFANAYGWPVIDHLVEEHFSAGKSDIKDDVSSPALEESTKQSDDDADKHGDDHSGDITLEKWDPSVSDSNDCSKVAERRKDRLSSAPAGFHVTADQSAFTSGSSSGSGWAAHLNDDSDDSEDDGIVHSMGGIIDNIKGIVGSVSSGTAAAKFANITEEPNAEDVDYHPKSSEYFPNIYQ